MNEESFQTIPDMSTRDIEKGDLEYASSYRPISIISVQANFFQ